MDGIQATVVVHVFDRGQRGIMGQQNKTQEEDMLEGGSERSRIFCLSLSIPHRPFSTFPSQTRLTMTIIQYIDVHGQGS